MGDDVVVVAEARWNHNTNYHRLIMAAVPQDCDRLLEVGCGDGVLAQQVSMHVTEGPGFVQSRGGDIGTIRSGDVVYTPADEWHWHGAAPDHFMTHLSITEGGVQWGEHVTDAEYRGKQK